MFPSQEPHKAAFAMYCLLVFPPSRLHWDFFFVVHWIRISLSNNFLLWKVSRHTQCRKTFIVDPRYLLCINSYQLMANPVCSISLAPLGFFGVFFFFFGGEVIKEKCGILKQTLSISLFANLCLTLSYL